MAAVDDEEEKWPFVPDPWRPDAETGQDTFPPSQVARKAAELSFITAQVQQATGWLILTHFGIILGSFGPMMSRPTFWLSWGIFILEALSKLVRSYINNQFFRDVPCSYVPLHRRYVPFAFGLYAQWGAALVGLFLCIPLWILFMKDKLIDNSTGCQDGVQRLHEVLLAACAITFFHFLSGMVAIGTLIRAIMVPEENLRCLTWLVHLSRHAQLSAAAASTRTEVCGLPGDWFQSVKELHIVLEKNLESSALSHDHGLMQVMAMRALLNFCKQNKNVLENDGFNLITRASTVGSMECKGLAAAIIGVSATGELKKANVEIERAIRPLKLLLKAEEANCRERALGALVNTTLLHEQRNKVLTELLEDDELLRVATFIEFLIEQATAGPTCGCQVLATSLLGQLVNNASARNIICTEERIKVICVMVEKGQTLEVRAAAAGFLWELAYSARGSLVGRNLRNCVSSLVKCLRQGDAQVARNAAGALASFAYKHGEAKNLITGEAEAIPTIVKVLNESVVPEVQVQACRLLWILADNNAGNQSRIREANAIPLLSKLLRKLDRLDIVVQAAWAISRLARKCRVNQDSMASPDLQIISSLLQLLKLPVGREWEVVWEKAAHALGEIANDHEGNQEMIVKEKGVVEALVDLLRSDIERQRVPIFAARALRMLAEGNHGDAKVIVKNKAILKLKELRDSPVATKSKKLKTAAEEALRTLDLEN